MTLEYKQSLTEVNVIIHFMDPKYLKKLPKKFISFVNNNMDLEYIPNIDKNIPIDEQELKQDTRVLLSLLYRNYWCDSEKKKMLIKEDLIAKLEEKNALKEKYSYENLFKDSNKNKKEEIISQEPEKNTTTELIEYEEPKWYKKILNKIINFFKGL